MILVSFISLKWPPFGKDLLTQLIVWFLCIMSISHVCFEGGTLVLITQVPGHCLHFTTVNVKAATNQ